ncbi:MAG TPA: GNAT family N-acetyltransferase [Ramlibacter sp.]
MPDFILAPADAVDPADLHAAFVAAFADYLPGPFEVALGQWPAFLARQCVHLPASRVAVAGGIVQSFALVAPRPDRRHWRLGTMGAVPAARGTGAAPALLDDFIARARAAGQAQAELECFAQNERGVRLYRSRSFETVHELHGYGGMPHVLAGSDAAADASVEAVPLDDAFAWLERAGRECDGLPLQVTPPSLRALPVALQAWRHGRAQVIASDGADRLVIHSLVDLEPTQTSAERLVAHLMRRAAGSTVFVPQLQREDLGGRALARCGLQRLPLHQLLMRRPLQVSSGRAPTPPR